MTSRSSAPAPSASCSRSSRASRGAGRIFITDVVPRPSREKPRELGFGDVIDSTDVDAAAVIREAVPGGVDGAFDCAGVQPTLESALGVTRNDGTLMAVAIFGKPVMLPFVLLTAKGITLKTTLAYANKLPPDDLAH